jgi:hypothetical protein
MSDQNAAPQEEEQPTADTPVEGTGTQDTAAQVNWEERYKEAQSWGTRLAQERAELEQEAQLARALKSEDPAEYTEALRALGFNVPDDDADEDTQTAGLDPEVAARLAKVDEIDQWRQQLTAEQEREVNEQQYRQLVDPQLQDMKVPEGLWDVVAEAALNLPAVQTPQGPQPDLEGAMRQVEAMAEHFAALPSVQSAVKKSWANSKPRTALTGAVGAEGTQVLDTDKHENRVAYMMARLNDNQT